MRAYSKVIILVTFGFFFSVADASYECQTLFNSSDSIALNVTSGLQILKTPGYFNAPRITILVGGGGTGKSYSMDSDFLPTLSSQDLRAERVFVDSWKLNWEALEGWRIRALAKFGMPAQEDPLKQLDVLVIDGIQLSFTPKGDAISTSSTIEDRELADMITNLVAQRYLQGKSTILIQGGRDYRKVSPFELINGISAKIDGANKALGKGVDPRFDIRNPVYKPFLVIDFGSLSRRRLP